MARSLKDWIESYMEYTAPFESPDSFHRWVGIFMVASVLKRRVWMDEEFKFFPNQYILLVGPAAGPLKSSTAGIGINLLKRLRDQKSGKQIVNFGSDSVTWQAALHEMREYEEEVFTDGILSITFPQSAMSCLATEFVTFIPPSEEQAKSALNRLWDCETSFSRNIRKDGKVVIKAPCLNLLACTTPGDIRDYFTENFFTSGLGSRMIIVYEEDIRKVNAYPISSLSPEARTARESLSNSLLSDLREMARLVGPYKLSGEARKEGEDIKRLLHIEKPKWEKYPRMQSLIARKWPNANKLAIIRAAMLRDERVIYPDDLIWGLEELDKLDNQILKAVEMVEVTTIPRSAERLAKRIAEKGEIGRNELFLENRLLMDWKEYEEHIEGLLRTLRVKTHKKMGNYGEEIVVLKSTQLLTDSLKK